MIRVRPVLLLAVTATGTAVSMSVLAGWQRGGWLAERLVWVAIGVVLVVSAHLIPALCRSAPTAVRGVSVALWLGCMGATSYGHATFFLVSQFHAGEVRGAAVPVLPVPAHRDLVTVMTDRALVTTKLAQANVRHCIRDCPSLRVRRASLAARLDALDAEANEIRRYQVIEDGNDTRLNAVRDDPVTARLATLLGFAIPKLDLLAGLAFSTVLEGVACLLWWLALKPQETGLSVTDLHEAATDVMIDAPAVTTVAQSAAPHTETEVAKLMRDIESGNVKLTVASIRRHLRCSQARAAALRRQIASSTL
jgi:hypothetical protein